MGSEQQFCLRWNNHQSTLISVFDTLLESETLVDVTLAAEGQYLKAHKVVLSACSQYFQELLCHHLEKHPIIILKDVTFQELKALIDYMYRGEVNVSQEQLSALIKTAESLKIKGLADGGDRRPDRKSVPQLSPPLPPVLAPALSGNLSLDSRSMGAADYATNSPLQHGPREGSISPVSRKRKRIRRRSGEGVVGGGGAAHEGDIGGGSEQASSSASTLSVPNIPATITPVNSGSRTTPGDVDGGDEEGVSGSKMDGGGQEDGAQGPTSSSKQTKSEPGTSLQSHSQTPLLEPKSEYREEEDDDGEADEDSMDNVVALDEDVMDMEGSRDDGLDQKAGPSHGAEVSGQGSGFAPWHMMPDRSGDDIFIPSQETAAQRESQEEQWSPFPFPRTALATSPIPSSTSTSLVPYTSSTTSAVVPLPPPSSPPTTASHRHHGPHPSSPKWAVSPRQPSHHLPLATQRPQPGGRQVRRRVVVALLPPDEEEEAPAAPLPHHLFPPHHHHHHLTGPSGRLPPLSAASYAHASVANTSATTTSAAATTTSSSSSPTSSKSYACPRCDRRYSVSYTLERHLRYECGVAKQFACPVCLRRFSRRDVLRAHQRKAGHHHHQHHRHHLVPSPTSAASRAVEEAASAVVELPAEVVGSLFSGK